MLIVIQKLPRDGLFMIQSNQPRGENEEFAILARAMVDRTRTEFYCKTVNSSFVWVLGIQNIQFKNTKLKSPDLVLHFQTKQCQSNCRCESITFSNRTI